MAALQLVQLLDPLILNPLGPLLFPFACSACAFGRASWQLGQHQRAVGRDTMVGQGAVAGHRTARSGADLASMPQPRRDATLSTDR